MASGHKYKKQLNLFCFFLKGEGGGDISGFEGKYSLMQNKTGYQVYLVIPWHP